VRATGADFEARYLFNALNWRVGKVVTTTGGTSSTYFIHDTAGQVLEERDGSDALLALYTYNQDIDLPLTMERGGNTYYYQRDAQASITEVSDQNGQLVEQVAYDIYGAASIRDGSGNMLVESAIGNPFLYTGRRIDPETGNFYFRARVYDPDTGRFMQMDPAGYIDGMNLYASYFVVNQTDPSGLEAGVTTITLFSQSSYKGWGGGITISYVQQEKDCCKDGINVSNGMRKYGIRITVDLGYAYEARRYVGGKALYDAGLKGPKISGTTQLSAKSSQCGGPVDAAELCRDLDVFAGVSGSLAPPDPFNKTLSIRFTAGVKGTLKTCATVTSGNLQLKTEFCGTSEISLTYVIGGKLARTLVPDGYKVTGCSTIFNKDIPLEF
jgi:RHS repeat-associated protein